MVKDALRWLFGLLAATLLAGAVATVPFGMSQQVHLRVTNSGQVVVVQLRDREGRLPRYSLHQVGQNLRLWQETGELQRAVRGTWTSWGRSLRVLLPGLALGLVAGIGLGILAAAVRLVREPAMGLSLVLFALPDFSYTIFLQLLVVVIYQQFGLRLASVGGARAWGLPVVALAVFPAAWAARVTADAVTRATRELYMRTAVAKGLSRSRALLRHGLRHVAGELMAELPGLAGISLSNLVMVEILFSYPGVAAQAFDAVKAWPGQPDLIPAGMALAVMWYALGGLGRTLRGWLLPYVAAREEPAA